MISKWVRCLGRRYLNDLESLESVAIESMCFVLKYQIVMDSKAHTVYVQYFTEAIINLFKVNTF